jgi:hypothetical protein
MTQGENGCKATYKNKLAAVISIFIGVEDQNLRWAQSVMDRWIDTDGIERYYQSILLVSVSSMLLIDRLKFFLFLIDSIDNRS